jgi:hypothetical protein
MARIHRLLLVRVLLPAGPEEGYRTTNMGAMPQDDPGGEPQQLRYGHDGRGIRIRRRRLDDPELPKGRKEETGAHHLSSCIEDGHRVTSYGHRGINEPLVIDARLEWGSGQNFSFHRADGKGDVLGFLADGLDDDFDLNPLTVLIARQQFSHGRSWSRLRKSSAADNPESRIQNPGRIIACSGDPFYVYEGSGPGRKRHEYAPRGIMHKQCRVTGIKVRVIERDHGAKMNRVTF